MTADAAHALRRAGELYAQGVAANEEMRPALGVRRLRAALEALDLLPSEASDASDASQARAAEVCELRGRALISLAMSEAELGRGETGLRLLDQAAGLVPPERLAVLHAQRAIILRRLGREDQALDEYGASLGLLRETGSPAALVAKVLLNRSILHIASVRLGAARSDLTRALRLATDEGEDVLVAKVLHNLGFLEYAAGNLPASLRWYAEAEPYYRRLLPGMLAMLGLDRARALLGAGLVTEVEHELGTVVPQLGRQRSLQDQAEGLLVWSESALLDGRPRDARRYAARAGAVFGRRQNHRWAARARLAGARADLALGGRAAREVAARAADLREEFGRLGMAEEARVAGLIAARARLAGDDAGPAEDVASLRPGRADRLETVLLWRATRAELAAAAGRPVEAAAERRRGLESLHRARARLGALDLQGGAALLGRELATSGLRSALRTGRPADVFAWAERARAQAILLPPVVVAQDDAARQELRAVTLALNTADLNGEPTGPLRNRRDRLRREVRQSAWSADGPGASARPVSLREVREMLGGGVAMAVYVADGDRLFALVITDRSARLAALDSLASAERAVARLRADLDTRAGLDLPAVLADVVEESARRDAQRVSACVLDPLLPHVGDRELVVVPTGALITVPWDTLTACSGRPVTVAPSATTWAERRRRARPAYPASTLVAAGPRVPHGIREIEQIAALPAARPRTVVSLARRSATVSAVLDALAGSDLAHLTAHGHHETDNPLFSGLELADGYLMGYDLLRLPRTPAVTVLSACDLGLHDTRPGDESLGMAGALLAAGARTVVAAVARVDDETAMRTGVAFHEALLAGLSPAAALADASSVRPAGFVCFGAG